MPQPSDLQRLNHILEAMDWIVEFIGAMELEEYRVDHKTQLSVERSLEIIGEAANHLSPELTARYKDIPWRQIVDMRNVLSHEYFQVRHEIVWQVIAEELPPLAGRISKMIEELRDSDEDIVS